MIELLIKKLNKIKELKNAADIIFTGCLIAE
jgi:hypothetical protein